MLPSSQKPPAVTPPYRDGCVGLCVMRLGTHPYPRMAICAGSAGVLGAEERMHALRAAEHIGTRNRHQVGLVRPPFYHTLSLRIAWHRVLSALQKTTIFPLSA